MTLADTTPALAVAAQQLVPVSDHLGRMTPIPASRMFLINKSLAVYRKHQPQGETFDASQGDGGASLPGVSPALLERAAALQREHGSAYDMPYGCDLFRRAVIERYWQAGPASGIGPENVLATVGGRDALLKAYGAMLDLGHGRAGDLLGVTRVPWISYTWGPYGVGANVLLAPGSADDGWAFDEQALQACAEYAARLDRRLAGVIVTSPDNPTGKTLSAERQVALGKATVFGPHTHNFKATVRELKECSGAIEVADAAGLESVLKALLADPARRAEIGRAGQARLIASKGALARYMELVARLLA